MRRPWLMLAAGALAAWAVPAVAQAPRCTYDDCALSLSGYTRVVQGREARPVSTGAFVPRVEALAIAPEPVRRHYEASRRHQRRSALLTAASLAAGLGAYLYHDRRAGNDWRPAPGVGLPLAAVAFGALSEREGGRGAHRMEAAVWAYNRALPPDSAAPGGCPLARCGLRLRAGRVVRGDSAAPLGRVGSPAVAALFAAAGDDARVPYDAAAAVLRRVGPLRRFATRASLAGAAAITVSDAPVVEGVAAGLLLLGYGAGHLSWYGAGRAAYDLDRAIWFYNRALPRGEDAPADP